MNRRLITFLTCMLPMLIIAQDLSEGLIVNDLAAHPMQDLTKPDYLKEVIDPSFGTTIRRISNAGLGEAIVPMYSTIQAWNADESLMILYNQSTGNHELLHGMTYESIRTLDDVSPVDLEQIFWDFNDPDIFYYHENHTNDFIRYTVGSKVKQTIVNLQSITACAEGLNMGNDVQMMSWDSDVFTFRCGNETAYSYRISTEELTSFTIDDVNYAAPAVSPSGNRYYHGSKVYDSTGVSINDLNVSSVEHSCLGKFHNNNDGYFAIAFAEGPDGGCIGDIIAHDLVTGQCIPMISQAQGYDYPQSGTHISALAHKNTDGGWIAASMMGYDKDGQSLLDQELVIAKAEEGNIKICRIGHHRSDEDQFDYWGEPHAVISPSGTRVLFGSDWSGSEDGKSVDSYVVELPVYSSTVSANILTQLQSDYKVSPNPVRSYAEIEFENPSHKKMSLMVYDSSGRQLLLDNVMHSPYKMNTERFIEGLYFFKIFDLEGTYIKGKFIKIN